MISYYMFAVLFVVVTNYAVLFLRMDERPLEQIFSVPFAFLTIFFAMVTLLEIRKIKKKADQYDAQAKV